MAAGIGAASSLVFLSVLSQPFDQRLSDYFRQTSVPEAHGHNLVNVIIVDFRALDTLGEITVLGLAANLSIFLAGRIGERTPPLVGAGETVLVGGANPLPQALILTAIVISFSLVAFTVVLFESTNRIPSHGDVLDEPEVRIELVVRLVRENAGKPPKLLNLRSTQGTVRGLDFVARVLANASAALYLPRLAIQASEFEETNRLYMRALRIYSLTVSRNTTVASGRRILWPKQIDPSLECTGVRPQCMRSRRGLLAAQPA